MKIGRCRVVGRTGRGGAVAGALLHSGVSPEKAIPASQGSIQHGSGSRMDYAPCIVLLGSLRALGWSAAARAATMAACACRGALRAKASNVKGRADRVWLTEDAGWSGSQRRVTGVGVRRRARCDARGLGVAELLRALGLHGSTHRGPMELPRGSGRFGVTGGEEFGAANRLTCDDVRHDSGHCRCRGRRW